MPDEKTRPNLDVSAEEARALHRVVRAMHDGHCPSCGFLGRADHFVRFDHLGVAPALDHVCPQCGFTIRKDEAQAVLDAFRPYLSKSLEVFVKWREARNDSTE